MTLPDARMAMQVELIVVILSTVLVPVCPCPCRGLARSRLCPSKGWCPVACPSNRIRIQGDTAAKASLSPHTGPCMPPAVTALQLTAHCPCSCRTNRTQGEHERHCRVPPHSGVHPRRCSQGRFALILASPEPSSGRRCPAAPQARLLMYDEAGTPRKSGRPPCRGSQTARRPKGAGRQAATCRGRRNVALCVSCKQQAEVRWRGARRGFAGARCVGPVFWREGATVSTRVRVRGCEVCRGWRGFEHVIPSVPPLPAPCPSQATFQYLRWLTMRAAVHERGVATYGRRPQPEMFPACMHAHTLL